MHMVSVFFADTVNAKARQTSTITSIVLASLCGNCETIQASSAYSIPHTARRTYSVAGSGPIDVEGSFRSTSSVRMAGSSLNLWRTTFSATAKKMLNNSGDNTHPCRSPRSTSNHYRASLPYYNSIVGGDKSPHCPMKTMPSVPFSPVEVWRERFSVPSSPVEILELSFPFLRKIVVGNLSRPIPYEKSFPFIVSSR